VRWYAVLAALFAFPPPSAQAAEDLQGAARELARKTASFAGQGQPVSLVWRNISSSGASELADARRAFEEALRAEGGSPGEVSPAVEAEITLSESARQFLLVEEARKGEEQQIWIAAWPRPENVSESSISMRLERTLLWRQREPILDAAFLGDDTALVLSRSWITWLKRQNGHWKPGVSQQLPASNSWPRDPRGRVHVNGGAFQIFLPGMECLGAAGKETALECRASNRPWLLEPDPPTLFANLVSGRNYFDGRVMTHDGASKTIGPFFSAAAAGNAGARLWLFAALDGRTEIFTNGLEPLGAISGWGSDVAGIGLQCGGVSPVLATKGGDASEPDSIQAYTVNERAAAPLTPPLAFPGPITALWSAGGRRAVAVSRDLVTGLYEAYAVTLVCTASP
jgi:hypothetical protein